jgi:hypothetical protein
MIYGSWKIDGTTHELHSLRHANCNVHWPHVDDNCVDRKCLRDLNVSIPAYEDCLQSPTTCWNADDDAVTYVFKQCLSQLCLNAKRVCEEVRVHHHQQQETDDYSGKHMTDDQFVPYWNHHPNIGPGFCVAIGALGSVVSLCIWCGKW